MTTTLPPTTTQTLAQLIERLGGIAPTRIRVRLPLGRATEQDVLNIEAHEDRLFELVDGVLVEKVMGYLESRLAAFLIRCLDIFVDPRNLGLVTGADGMVRLTGGLVR